MRRPPAGIGALAVLAAGLIYIAVSVIPDALSDALPVTCSAEIVHSAGFKATFFSSSSLARAQVAQLDAQSKGFTGTKVEEPACGRYEVVLRGIPSPVVGRDFAHEVAQTGLRVTIGPG